MIVVKMAEGETEKEYDTRKTIEGLRERFQNLTTTLKESSGSSLEASLHFCQEFCQVSLFPPRRPSLQPPASWPRMRVYVGYNNVAKRLVS